MLNRFSNNIFGFFKRMVSSEDEISSKRVVGFGAFLMIIIISFVCLLTKYTIEEFIWWGLLGLVVSCFGLGTIENIKSSAAKSTIVSDIIKNEPASDTIEGAKDILNTSKTS